MLPVGPRAVPGWPSSCSRPPPLPLYPASHQHGQHPGVDLGKPEKGKEKPAHASVPASARHKARASTESPSIGLPSPARTPTPACAHLAKRTRAQCTCLWAPRILGLEMPRPILPSNQATPSFPCSCPADQRQTRQPRLPLTRTEPHCHRGFSKMPRDWAPRRPPDGAGSRFLFLSFVSLLFCVFKFS